MGSNEVTQNRKETVGSVTNQEKRKETGVNNMCMFPSSIHSKRPEATAP